MGLAHFTLDLKTLFERRVMQDFTGSYAKGRTPNPCVMCNAHVKFHAVAAVADTLGFESIATGHYARVVEGPALARAADLDKDQTYVLWPVPREMLARTVFPLGELHSKDETRHMAEENGLSVARTPESQDICFIPDGDYRGFVRRHISSQPGEIVDGEGNRLGEHSGITNYTVGQRRGLGVSSNSGPLYVREVRPQSNQVVVGHGEELRMSRVTVGGMNWFREPGEATSVQLRYKDVPVPCTVETKGRSSCVAHLDEPVTKTAPGQSAVFYDGDIVVGGGMVLRERDGNGRTGA
jgi:tRNA-specific 2-thiouridylase